MHYSLHTKLLLVNTAVAATASGQQLYLVVKQLHTACFLL